MKYIYALSPLVTLTLIFILLMKHDEAIANLESRIAQLESLIANK